MTDISSEGNDLELHCLHWHVMILVFQTSLFTDISTNMVTWNSYFEGDQIIMNDSKKMRKTTLSCNVCSSSWDTTALSLSTWRAGKWIWPMTNDIDKSHDSCRYEEKILFLRNHPHLLSRNWGHQLLPHLFDKMVSLHWKPLATIGLIFCHNECHHQEKQLAIYGHHPKPL